MCSCFLFSSMLLLRDISNHVRVVRRYFTRDGRLTILTVEMNEAEVKYLTGSFSMLSMISVLNLF